MASKAFLVLGVLLAVILVISTEVAARELAEETKKDVDKYGHDEHDHHDGHGGHDHDGHHGHDHDGHGGHGHGGYGHDKVAKTDHYGHHDGHHHDGHGGHGHH